AVVRQFPLPPLECPVRSIGRFARRHEPAQARPVVAAAKARERLPVLSVVLPVASGIVELELDLLSPAGGRETVHGAPGKHAPRAAADRVLNKRLAVRVDG